MSPPRIVLASASPRRCELLEQAGLRFDLAPSGVEEVRQEGEAPGAYALRNARAKARAVVDAFDGCYHVIGADTIVVLGDEVLEKPRDAADALRMLRLLRGRSHEVMTGMALIKLPSGEVIDQLVRTRVTFRDVPDEALERYVHTGEPMDKAGGYAIQGGAAHMVQSLDGSYTNVVGLPMAELMALLDRA